ncbi:aldo/keto reductase [Demequina activiva]|uniref:Aldo/keto reductase n=1 Tax=Demequina activiva TaxID=1582364 RepID=A0A919UJA9_9MICO|nr:aldo/keto reductase [Demequina activiva]GIG54191.1 aldo/keto reductase [Demequina activiva]
MTTTDTAVAGRTLAGTDATLVPIALGAMIMGTRTPEGESRRILDHFLGEVAPRYAAADGSPARAMIDTADCYCWWEAPGSQGGHSESLLGRWMADAGVRDRVFLATKATGMVDGAETAWKDGEADWEYARQHFVGASAPVLKRSLEASLERLATDRIDLYYVHVDDLSTPLEETLETLAGFVADGRIGAYGWSNVRAWRLAQIRALCEQHGWPQPVALQQQHSYLRRRAGLRHGSIVGDEQLDYLEHHPDLQLVAYSPVLKGAYSDRSRRGADFWAMGNYAGPDADARFAAVDEVASQTGATGNQVVLAWMLAQDSPSVLPLIGPRTYDQYRENIDALHVELTAEQVAMLDAAGA